MNLIFSGLSDAKINFSISMDLIYSLVSDSIAFASNFEFNSIWILMCVWHYKETDFLRIGMYN